MSALDLYREAMEPTAHHSTAWAAMNACYTESRKCLGPEGAMFAEMSMRARERYHSLRGWGRP